MPHLVTLPGSPPSNGPEPSRRAAGLLRAAGGALLLVAASIGTSGPAAMGQAAEAEASPSVDAGLIAEALRIIGERYVDEDALTTDNLTAGAIRGMVEALGDEGHTAYLTAEEYAVEQDALDGRVLGIGVVLDQRARAPLVISVIDGSPADRAGVRAGDIIASVDDVETSRLPLDDLAGLVRGTAGSRVRIGVERPGESDLLDLSIVREDVFIEAASWARVPGSDVAVVRIVQFSQAAGERVREAISAALSGGAGGLVLDLRGNPGGLVDEALSVASAFLDGGVAYQESDRDDNLREVLIPDGRVIAPDVPVNVLVDYATASSAEILATALRDNGRAAIVGEQTYGTGTVLNTFDLSDGSALKVGVRSWLTPAGDVVFRVGVEPDHEVTAAPGTALLRPADLATMTAEGFNASGDLALRRAVGLLEPLAAR
ncbi:MAG TPA: S41 family peptidase [Candidatus Deferrimicrobium sp.]|nr:S41 family peptidase [Candidatus Deferrimicrobium sp.]